ncbi:MAG: hypothetical protein ACYSUF_11680 [Planctomycetota bacterium]
MIVLECDNCERSFEVESRHAGGKVPCPHCGDVNRVPGDTEPAAEPAKRLGGKELPPDEGPEQDAPTRFGSWPSGSCSSAAGRWRSGRRPRRRSPTSGPGPACWPAWPA